MSPAGRPVPRRRGRAVALGLGWFVATWLGVAAVRASVVEVRGSSMEPTLWPGDRLLTLPLSRGGRAGVGRLVVVAAPPRQGAAARDGHHLVVKRVHAHVGRAHVDLRGDDPMRSTDSRAWGPVPWSRVRRVVVGRLPDVRTRLTRVPDGAPIGDADRRRRPTTPTDDAGR